MTVDQLVYAYVANEETYPDKTVVIEEGSKGDWVYLVLEGQLRVKKSTAKGKVNVYTLKEGDILGEMLLLEPGKGVRTASVIADGPVRLGVLDTAHLVKDYDTISPQLKGLIRSLIQRLEETTDKVCALAVETT
ncbi:MAG: cyclic nucleotide-binding domain-containing protein [Deltaproteobacteria bacterium]|nr:cyclic nucleotide-binding domain-containing protein [Deltaproteobacteria bacterium]MBW1738335.1 cyclic nucleotide-binding domain-containing protein [Deltaproteobacteria bacterium]MBW1909133.1 cyclic nucleotide-binding domain-containing protein [Deltaproteobacteria bacterium]MBW2035599.1 cyclic nucleotide-binding domain-containing protein [Deltaproteobacteria bacterium]MBW2170101.1 cyclic nucleotide-binding domain-containing protein [Deltaproteobacteria bacterium]